VGVAAAPVSAQYSAVTTPFGTASDSFFENMGIGFGFSIPGAGFLPGDDHGPSGTIGLGPTGAPTPNLGLPFTGGGGVAPPFGGGLAGAGRGGFGFGMAGGGLNTFGNMNFSQGSSRSFVMETPMVVVPNGGQGTIIDATQRPFVTGFIPVVGGYGPGPGYGLPSAPAVSPLFERIQRLNAEGALRRQTAQQADVGVGARQDNQPLALGAGASQAASSAERGDLSVAEIRRQQAAEGDAADAELAAWIERARGAEAAGKRNVARIYYRMAASRATGDLRKEFQAKYLELGGDQP
jgi:hypothetical protein